MVTRLSMERLASLVSYDPATGEMRWAKTISYCGKARIGALVGGPNRGAQYVGYAGKTYGVHQLAWFIVTGQKPERGLVIDHINGDPFDNRFANLRRCTQAENSRNAVAKKKALPFKGVHFYKRDRKWAAGIMLNRQRKHLGYFASAYEAARAYDIAARAMHGEFARLNFPEGASA